MLFHITDCITQHNISGVVTKRLQCLQVMFKFSGDLIGRSGFFLPPLYIVALFEKNETITSIRCTTFIPLSKYKTLLCL